MCEWVGVRFLALQDKPASIILTAKERQSNVGKGRIEMKRGVRKAGEERRKGGEEDETKDWKEMEVSWNQRPGFIGAKSRRRMALWILCERHTALETTEKRSIFSSPLKHTHTGLARLCREWVSHRFCRRSGQALCSVLENFRHLEKKWLSGLTWNQDHCFEYRQGIIRHPLVLSGSWTFSSEEHQMHFPANVCLF